MKLWPAIIKQLTASSPEVRKGTAWVCGTAVQNNTQAQEAFLTHGGLEPLLKLLSDDEDVDVRSKALYATSGFLKHNSTGVKAFDALNGFDVLENMLKSSKTTPAILRKIIFLYNSLIIDDRAVADKLVKDGTIEDLDKILVKYTTVEEDEDIVEKVLRTIHSITQNTTVTLSPAMKKHCLDAKNKYGADNLNLIDSEWKDLC
ncbi:armadillo-type protein [Pilobolus umbonatus]|nr:armadillo-type protein [Pilobolus umbonatus]